MNLHLRIAKYSFLVMLAAGVTISCKKKKEEDPTPVEEPKNTTSFRGSFDYNKLTATTAYDSLFRDANGNKTVDLRDGKNRINMMIQLSSYASNANSRIVDLDSTVLRNMFLGSSFSVDSLNKSGVQLRNVTGLSSANPELVRRTIESFFAGIDIASASVADSAYPGKAGKVTANNIARSKYLLDKNGIELAQIIQKGLIGAYQYDYIANVLLSDASLNANNDKLVQGKNYTALEHTWDEAYANFTLNKIYAANATGPEVTVNASNGGERYLGAYTWEYNRNNFKKVYPAFQTGRAAIVNNDIAKVKEQAAILKGIMETAIASAAVGYLERWKGNIEGKPNADPDAGKHQIAEGLGFIYSLRFCKVNGGDDAFSDGLLNDLIYSNANGVWGLTEPKANQAIVKIREKFKLP